MRFKNIYGKEVNTDHEEIKCPYCNKIITKEEIENGQIFIESLTNPRTEEQYHRIWHLECVDPESINKGNIIQIDKWKKG